MVGAESATVNSRGDRDFPPASLLPQLSAFPEIVAAIEGSIFLSRARFRPEARRRSIVRSVPFIEDAVGASLSPASTAVCELPRPGFLSPWRSRVNLDGNVRW